MFRVYLLFIFAFGLINTALFSQSKEELEKQRLETQQIIESTTRLLLQTSETRQNSMERLSIVNRRLQLRESLIATIESEIRYIDNSISSGREKISVLDQELKEARDSYAQLIKISYKHRNSHQRMMFILSAGDFNQAYRRLKYLQQYGESRQKQISRIDFLTKQIVDEIEKMEVERGEKVILLSEKQNETDVLAQERSQQNSIVQDLRNKEAQLKDELTRQEKVARALQNAIEELLREETRISAEKRVFELTPEEQIISDQFQNNRGGLPWPIETGVVTGFFGEHPHPVLRGIKIQNNGIYISTIENAEVMALFDGIVRQVIRVPGSNNVVLIRHGNYLTVYANLSHVYVRSGDIVKTKQLIGRVFSDSDDVDNSVLELQIWEENTKLDPIIWLSRR